MLFRESERERESKVTRMLSIRMLFIRMLFIRIAS
jgi:hypothetical protein